VSKIRLIIVPILLLFTGCEDKPLKKTTIITHDTSEVFTKKDIATRLHRKNAKPFTVENDLNRSHALYVSKKELYFDKEYAPISIVTLFKKDNSTHQKILSQLQDRYSTLLFVLKIDEDTKNDTFFRSNDKTLFKILSNSINLNNTPDLLTILYVNGKYFTHYDGLVPIEMIQYDIEEAQKSI
jgi:hypothetical protein